MWVTLFATHTRELASWIVLTNVSVLTALASWWQESLMSFRRRLTKLIVVRCELTTVKRACATTKAMATNISLKKVNSRCTLSRLFHLVHFDKCLQDCIKAWSSGKEKKNRCLEHVSTVSTKHEMRQFHVLRAVTAKNWSTKKRDALGKFLLCQSNPTVFCRSRCRPRRRCLSSLLFQINRHVTWFCLQTQNLGKGH